VAAIDLATRELRTSVLTTLWREEHVIAFGCGERTLRLRPALSMSPDDVDAGCDAMHRVLGRLA
jgi:L-lysine 6-transaminase